MKIEKKKKYIQNKFIKKFFQLFMSTRYQRKIIDMKRVLRNIKNGYFLFHCSEKKC